MRLGFPVAFLFLASQPAVWAQGAVAPSIIAHPLSVHVLVGDPATLTASIEGSPTPGYQWRKNGVNIPGATASSYTITSAVLGDAGQFDLVASNPSGTVTTLPAFIAVSLRPQTITFNPPAAAVAAGSGIVLGATASSGLPVTYTVISGNALLAAGVLTGTGGSVTVRATQAGNTTFAAAPAVDRTIAFVAGALAPFITSPPTDQTVTVGTPATFRATAIGTPAPTYQWQKDGVDLPGATGPVLTLAATTLADSGRYSVTVGNLVATATAGATLTVRSLPVLTAVPQSATVFAGSPASFTITAIGVPAPTYQWRKNGANIAGATRDTLGFTSTVAADAGRYEVVVTNVLGSVTTPAATLTVNTRDLAGTYFGQFAGTGGAAAGNFVLHVRANRSAILLGHVPAQGTVLVSADLTVDLSGNFARNVSTGARTVALRGAIDDAIGEVTGTVADLGLSLRGTRAAATGPAAAHAGVYQAALVGSAAGVGFIVVAGDGQAFVLTGSSTAADSARGTVGANGRLALTTLAGAAVDVGFIGGVVSGTVRAPGITGNFLGAIEALIGREHIVNLSIRSTTSNAAPLITGFVVGGTAAKQLLIRVAGPTLARAPFNVANALADPAMQVFRGNSVVAQNNDWGTPAANAAAISAAAARVGAFPFFNGSEDAALLGSLPPGPYTVVVSGGNGTVVAEIYEVLENNETAGARRLVNVSARGSVTPGAPLIAGFVIAGPAPQRVLIRGIGPTLGAAPFNLPGVLANPQLTLFRGSAVVKTNDDWFRDADAVLIRDAALRAGAFALGAQSADASILIYLEPGAYTAQVSGPTNATGAAGSGTAIIEVYESPL